MQVNVLIDFMPPTALDERVEDRAPLASTGLADQEPVHQGRRTASLSVDAWSATGYMATPKSLKKAASSVSVLARRPWAQAKARTHASLCMLPGWSAVCKAATNARS